MVELQCHALVKLHGHCSKIVESCCGETAKVHGPPEQAGSGSKPEQLLLENDVES